MDTVCSNNPESHQPVLDCEKSFVDNDHSTKESFNIDSQIRTITYIAQSLSNASTNFLTQYNKQLSKDEFKSLVANMAAAAAQCSSVNIFIHSF